MFTRTNRTHKLLKFTHSLFGITLFLTSLSLSLPTAGVFAQNAKPQPTNTKVPSPLKERRVALIVANSAYSKISELDNPVNDANDLKRVLERLDFAVDLRLDLNGAEFKRVVTDFSHVIRTADIALFFFAGHGFQYKGQNYLLGVDATLSDEAGLAASAVNGGDVVSTMENAPGDRINLVFLDACRDNPLGQSPSAPAGLKASGSGLAKMEQGYPDTLIAFSALPGTPASDGIGKNSPFVRALLKHIETPDLEVSVLLKIVGRDVSQVTFNKQRPQQLTGMNRLFYFKPERAKTSPPATFEGGVVVAEFAAWQLLCKATPLGDRGACAAVQSVAAVDKANLRLTIYYQRFPNGKKVLRVFAPLGVLLAPGLGLKIDGVDIGHAPFLRCNKNSCYAQVELTGAIERRMEDGKQAVFIIFQEETSGLGVPIALDQFRGAVRALGRL